MIFLIFGSLLAPFGSLLAPFWLPSNVKLFQKSCFCSIWFHLLLMFETIFIKKVNVGTLSARTRR